METKLWMFLRTLREQGVHFRRQHAIGSYVTDFCAPRHHLVIELDGSQHLDQEDSDNERTAFLRAQGFRVLRFWNDQVMTDVEGVMRAIRMALGQE